MVFKFCEKEYNNVLYSTDIFRQYGFSIIMFGFPILLRYVLSYTINKKVSWENYTSYGKIWQSMYLIIGYLLFQLSLLIFLPGKWWSPNNIFPKYKLNGLISYLSSIIISLLLFKKLSWVYQNFEYMVISLEIFAWILCILVYLKSTILPTLESPRFNSGNWYYDFVSGVEKYPAIGKYQLKQILNCRFGMMGWSTIILSCLSYQYQSLGYITNSLLVSSILQLVYIGKFFVWEDGYFLSADIVHDNLGFYILWGVVYAVPCFYTLTTLYLTNNHINVDTSLSLAYVLLGLISIYINYEADVQKEYSKKNPNGKIWGSPIKMFRLKQNVNGIIRESGYCLSGWWQFGRNIHYVPELLSCLIWSLPAGYPNNVTNLIPYIYFGYLFILLIHRIYRLEESCDQKYGAEYSEYKKLVPYRLIPYVF